MRKTERARAIAGSAVQVNPAWWKTEPATDPLGNIIDCKLTDPVNGADHDLHFLEQLIEASRPGNISSMKGRSLRHAQADGITQSPLMRV
jgi:hypothetical protein